MDWIRFYWVACQQQHHTNDFKGYQHNDSEFTTLLAIEFQYLRLVKQIWVVALEFCVRKKNGAEQKAEKTLEMRKMKEKQQQQ